jgi:hypothetical protein
MKILSFEYLETSGKTDYFSVRVKSGGFIVKVTAKITATSTGIELPVEIETTSDAVYIRLIEAIKRRYIRFAWGKGIYI